MNDIIDSVILGSIAVMFIAAAVFLCVSVYQYVRDTL
jgi:hypothetical protein